MENLKRYLLLYYNAPDSVYGYSEEQHFRKINSDISRLKATLYPFKLRCHYSATTRYAFYFEDILKTECDVERFLESFHFAMSLISGPKYTDIGSPMFLEIPEVFRDREVEYVDLLEFEDYLHSERIIITPPRTTIFDSQCTTCQEHELAWKITPWIFEDNDVFTAISYLVSSQEYLFIYPGNSRVWADLNVYPFNTLEKIQFEHSLEDCYRVVEALIGEPPRDRNKTINKLINIGIDPYMEINTDYSKTLIEEVYYLERIRSKKAAHLKAMVNRQISIKELVYFQAIARSLISSVIEKRACISL